MTQYYIDADNGSDINTGLGTSGATAWASVDPFMGAARTAGDICTVRRGTTAGIFATSVSVSSDGSILAPCILEADYDDAWTDFANSTQTYTMVFGSKTHTASATITGVVAGDWIYNNTDSDDPREWSYEVAAVSGTTLTLYLPYKGSTGATKTLKVMPASPKWNGGTSNWSFSGDNYWRLQGINIETTSSSGMQQNGDSYNLEFIDMTYTGLGGVAVQMGAEHPMYLSKCRSFDKVTFFAIGSNPTGRGMIRDCLSDGNSRSGSEAILNSNFSQGLEVIDCEFKNHALADINNTSATADGLTIHFRNCLFSSTTEFSGNNDIYMDRIYSEDHDGVIGKTKFFNYSGTGDNVPFYESDTGTVRSGGGNVSIKVTPGVTLGPGFFTTQQLLELPIYATTSSKTYDIYFKTANTTDWTADPTATELWIELEAWGHASNNFRKITKSTGVIDFNGSTAWQNLSVTVTPSQTGLAYLRCWYNKPKESTKTNIFWVDPKPVIT